MSKKVIKWYHWAVGAFKFLHTEIYGMGDINKWYADVADVLGISDVSTRLTINV